MLVSARQTLANINMQGLICVSVNEALRWKERNRQVQVRAT